MSDSTRWLFAWLAVISVLVCLPAILISSNEALLLGLAGAVFLPVSWVSGYSRKRAPVVHDVLDAAAIMVFASACRNPASALGIVFAAVWFRTLYGSRFLSFVRCVLYMAGIVLALLLGPGFQGSSPAPDPWPTVGAFPVLVLTVIVAWRLGAGLLAHEQSLGRDAALTRLGSKLLDETDTETLRAMAWSTASEICSVTPGLRILKVARDGSSLCVEGTAGRFRTVPGVLPADTLEPGAATGAGDLAPARIAHSDALAAAAGARLEWACIELPEQKDQAWLLVGAPKTVHSVVLVTIWGLVNQIALALRNSGIHRELRAQATMDSLTGLSNRAAFTAGLAARLSDTDRRTGVRVLFLDLDDFKDINDVYGHHGGDEMLTVVAGRLSHCTRPGDLCARLGGDEFAVILDGATDETALDVAQRMVDLIALPVLLGIGTARVGVSVGISAAAQEPSPESLTHQADAAMYEAKAHGKGRVETYHAGLPKSGTQRFSFERQLAAAAAAGEMEVHYQPILDLQDNRCTAVEALVRWQHPEHGLLHPGGFIELAQRTGAIADIGASVLRLACAEAANWPLPASGQPLSVHVNVSVRELESEHFVDAVQATLAATGLAPSRLVLELTESMVLNSPRAIGRLTALADRGIQIAVDDFGTGYASLTTFRSLPVNVVKIDKSFVAGALSSTVDKAVINAIVQMSVRLGIQTVAEGVERPEESEFLKEIGVDRVQGYLYCQPLPAEELREWLQQNLTAPETIDEDSQTKA